MLYDAISKGRVYKNQSVINYPTGAKKNYGELAIICAPSWEKSLQFISSPMNRWYLNGYKRYSMQTKYRQHKRQAYTQKYLCNFLHRKPLTFA